MEISTIPEPATTESNTLNEIIGRSKYMVVLKKCIDANAFKRVDDSIFPFILSSDTLMAVAGEEIQSIEADQNTWTDELDNHIFTGNFDFNNEAKQATQTVINLLNFHQLVGISVLRGATQYVGVGNTEYVEDQWDHQFKPTDEYHEYLQSKGLSSSRYELPVPDKRNEHFKLTIGGQGVKSNALNYLKISEQLSLGISDEDALRMAMVIGAAHEYGHSINRALGNTGINTFQRTKEQQLLRGIDTFGFIEEEIHDEHFARGIENTVLRYYLQDRLGFSNKQVLAFIDEYTLDWHRGESALAARRYAIAKGYSPDEVTKLENALSASCDELKGDKVYLWRSDSIISYHTKPYSESQIKQLSS